MEKKWLVIVLAAGIVGGLGIAGAFYWFVILPKPSLPETTPPPVPIGCTQEAKLCPDGSWVGRVGPKCEFALCPSTP